MIVDSSALVAILKDESDAQRYEAAIASASNCRMSIVNAFETAMVVEGRGGPEAGRELDRYIEKSRIVLEPVTVEYFEIARRAWRRFGKGNHPASLNFGDCFSYALAETAGEPLLFKGDDFALTDIEPA